MLKILTNPPNVYDSAAENSNSLLLNLLTLTCFNKWFGFKKVKEQKEQRRFKDSHLHEEQTDWWLRATHRLRKSESFLPAVTSVITSSFVCGWSSNKLHVRLLQEAVCSLWSFSSHHCYCCLQLVSRLPDRTRYLVCAIYFRRLRGVDELSDCVFEQFTQRLNADLPLIWAPKSVCELNIRPKIM